MLIIISGREIKLLGHYYSQIFRSIFDSIFDSFLNLFLFYNLTFDTGE